MNRPRLTKLVAHVAAVIALSSVFFACSKEEDTDSDVGDISAALESASMSVDGLDQITSTDPKEAAAQATKLEGSDKGCRTRVQDKDDPAVVHVYLDGCEKHFGRHTVSGEMKLTFSSGDADTILVKRESINLTVDGRAAENNALTEVVFSGTTRKATSEGTWMRTRENGEQIVRKGEHVVELDTSTRCKKATSDTTAYLNDEAIGTETSTIEWCELADGTETCPTGEMKHSRPAKGKTVVTRFDGSETAVSEITAKGRTTTVNTTLECLAD